jgi:hypothetical protein
VVGLNTGSSISSLLTVQVNDNNPLSLALVSTRLLPSAVTVLTSAQFGSTPDGYYLFANRSNTPAVQLCAPNLALTRYINSVPMNMPSSVSATIPYVGTDTTFTISGVFLQVLMAAVTRSASFTNFADIGESSIVSGSSNIFTPTLFSPSRGSMLVTIDVMVELSLPNLAITQYSVQAQCLGSAACGILIDSFTNAAFGAAEFHTFHIHGQLLMTNATPLQLLLSPTAGVTVANGSIGIQFMRYV